MYDNDPSRDLSTLHSLGAYRKGGLVTTGDPRRFVGIPTFLRAPLMGQVARPRIGIVGMPHDGGVVRTPGSRFGPRGIRAACWRSPVYNPALDVSIDDGDMVVDCGDALLSPLSIGDALQAIDRETSRLLDAGIVPVAVGGDHGITYPIMHAMHRVHGKFGVVHFDAHTDTLAGGFTHGTMFRLAVEEGLVEPENFIQVGIRKVYSAAEFDLQERHGIQVITADKLREMGSAGFAEQVRRLEGRKIYVTFDMDFVDQAYAPGTGSPEPCGPTSAEALACVGALSRLDIIGCDLTEVAPAYDVREMTCYLANLVLFEMVSILIHRATIAAADDAAR